MLTVVGLSFRSAPVELREKVIIEEAELESALRELGHGVILSTCNRTEIYQTSAHARHHLDAERFLTRRFAGPEDVLRSHLYRLEDRRAVRHLFAVAAGLDSMVLGEPQILGQVRAALGAAEAAGTAGPVLAHLFRQAVRVGRRARSETFVGRHAVSISSAAVELARRVFGRLDGCRALVVGAGEMGGLTVRTLVDHGVGVVAVANRTLENANALAHLYGGEAVALERVIPSLASADIVITSTDAPGYVISQADVSQAVACRDGRPLFIIDIAVPRDVDPGVRALPGVVLYDIDDLKALCDLNREGRQREVESVQRIIDDELERFDAWWQSRRAVPTIVALREQAERARRAELAEAFGHLRHLSEADRATIDALTRAIVQKLLHHPTTRLKEMAGRSDDSIRVARELFDLGTRRDAPASPDDATDHSPGAS
jgi:glutamyl-tRNA reductase